MIDEHNLQDIQMKQSYSKELRDEVLQLISSSEEVLSPKAGVLVIQLDRSHVLAAITTINRGSPSRNEYRIVRSTDSLDFWYYHCTTAAIQSKSAGFNKGDSRVIGKAFSGRKKDLIAAKNRKEQEENLRNLSMIIRGY